MKLIIYLIMISVLFWGCTKDKVPEPHIPTKYEIIAGNYKVYDTLGVFLYEMSIEHRVGQDSLGHLTDSLKFVNLDNHFTITKVQDGSTCSFKRDFLIGKHFPIMDEFNKRWWIMGLSSCEYNVSENNTIHLKFHKCNILYYLEDCTPYFDEIIYQVAVKQH